MDIFSPSSVNFFHCQLPEFSEEEDSLQKYQSSAIEKGLTQEQVFSKCFCN